MSFVKGAPPAHHTAAKDPTGISITIGLAISLPAVEFANLYKIGAADRHVAGQYAVVQFSPATGIDRKRDQFHKHGQSFLNR